MNSPLVLLILDGWGYSKTSQYNAIASAETPQWDQWWESCPHILLSASGPEVGLPEGQMGNSEVGHMHIGAGRMIPQDFTRINDAVLSGEFSQNKTLCTAMIQAKKADKAIHVCGLLSPGGVHSHENHLFAFLSMCAANEFKDVYLHLFLDGRDTPPQSALHSLHKLKNHLTLYPGAKIASISGRYYAMDRDKRWQRIAPVYELLTEQKSEYCFSEAEEALQYFYQQKITDEFIPPTRIGDGKAIEDGDFIFFFNFRADRARQLTQAFIDEQFSGFDRNQRPHLSGFITLTQYAKHLPTQVVFPPVELKNTLGEVLSQHDLSQLRIAETEKYAHVTFFLNGGSEQVYPNEDRILIPSSLVATYDLQPEMSASELTTTIIDAIKSKAYDVIICNFANADMVGHTGNFKATVQAVEHLDKCMSQIWETLKPFKGNLLITADHGNAEAMFDESTTQPHTAHTYEPVPFLFVGEDWGFCKNNGSLIDVAPTLLTLLNIKLPKEMTGQPLLEKKHA